MIGAEPCQGSETVSTVACGNPLTGQVYGISVLLMDSDAIFLSAVSTVKTLQYDSTACSRILRVM